MSLHKYVHLLLKMQLCTHPPAHPPALATSCGECSQQISGPCGRGLGTVVN